MDRRSLALVTALALGTAPSMAAAQRAHGATAGTQQNLLALGRQQYEDLRYEEALQTLSAAIIRRGNTPQDEIQIYELLALAYNALHRNDEAEGAYRLVLARDPSHQLSSDIAPQVVDFFNGVKQRWEAEGRPGIPHQEPSQQIAVTEAAPSPVVIEHRSPPEQQRGTPVGLTATVTDPGHRVARVVLAYRHGSSGLFHRIDATPSANGTVQATIPGAAVQPPLVEYYFEAVSSAGVPVQARGDAYAPLRVAVPQPGGLPWWAFVGGGVVVAGIVAGVVYFVVSSQSAPSTLMINVVGH